MHRYIIHRVRLLIQTTGVRVISMVEFSGFTILLLLKSLYYTKNLLKRRHQILRQMYFAIVRTFSVITIVALFTGMILTLQTGLVMKDYNMENQIGNVLIASLTKEMGPFSAAIILIAAVGSAMAAEIGTMRVSEEIDALEIMSISPADYLIMPRVTALIIMLPVATIYVNTLGVIGGAIISANHIGVPYDVFYRHVLESLHFKDVYVGLLKAFIFGIIISVVSCAHGLRAKNGALGVGRATRNSVVASFLLILIVGYYITDLFYRRGM